MEKENKKKYKGSLRLDWINKDLSLYYEIDEKEGKGVRPVWVPKNDIRVAEPRILRFEKSFGDATSDNMLIKGDNLLVLRSLVEMFKGKPEKEKVKCIYIDPPYNTGNAFKHYDDNLQHSQWLTMMRDRLFWLSKTLRRDGIIFIQINDTEAGKLRLLLDQTFGPKNYIGTFFVMVRNPHKQLSTDGYVNSVMEQIFVYGKSEQGKIKKKDIIEDYKDYVYEVIEKKKGKNKIIGGKEVIVFQKGSYEIKKVASSSDKLKQVYITGKIIESNSSGRYYEKYLKPLIPNDGYECLYKVSGIGDDGLGYRYILNPLSEKYKGGRYFQGAPLSNKGMRKALYSNFWDYASEFGNCDPEGGVKFLNGKKPEELLREIFIMSTEPGDLVLDIFGGSGTTGATAYKMGRKFILVEMGNHAETHCLKRLTNVLNGDSTGISLLEEINWKGGGGFKYYKLGDSLINEQDMNWELKNEEMAEAIFLHFQYKKQKAEWLEKENMYLGKHQFARYHFALAFASRDVKILDEALYEKIIAGLEKDKFKHLTIFTNVAVAVPPETLDERVFIKKIPATILREYNLL